jgi:hypothetical protein
MKNLIRSVLAVVLLAAASTSSAWFFDNDNYCPPWAYNCNPYDEWDPRYWMEEMEQEWDDDDYYGGPYGYPGYGGYGPGYGGYGPGYGGYGPGYGGYGPGYGGYGPGPGYGGPYGGYGPGYGY